MIYSSASAYAIQATCRLAMLRTDGYVLLGDLCRGTDLPRHFVAKVFRELVRNGLLVSARGRGGGFALARPAEEISLYDIVAAVDGLGQFEQCASGLKKCDHKQPCPQHERWSQLREQIRSYLQGTTIADGAASLQAQLQRLKQETHQSPPISEHA